jgi:polyferredoxin
MATTITFSRIKYNYKWGLALLMLLVLALGWKYPYLGIMVPIVMASGLVGAFFKGRVVCGNFCPRGNFFDTWFKPFGGARKAPKLLTSPLFRWSVLVVLFSFMIFQLSGNIGSVAHWGTVFWRVCLFTTLIALTVGVLYRPRAWCSFCPMGTIQGAIGGEKHPVSISASCSACGICEKNCPMGHDIAYSRESGTVINSDCLHCGACVATCPRNALQ